MPNEYITPDDVAALWDYLRQLPHLWGYLSKSGLGELAHLDINALAVLLGNICNESATWISREILTHRWFETDQKDWFIALVGGVIAGIIGGYLTILLLSRRVPKLEISKSIVLTGRLARIKVVNKRRKWWWAKGDAIDLKAELHLLKSNGESRRVALVRDEPLVLEYRCRAEPFQNEVVFRVTQNDTPKVTRDFCTKPEYVCIRFRICARDSLSNYAHVYSRLYCKGRRGYNPIIDGDFLGPGDVRIQPRPPTAP